MSTKRFVSMHLSVSGSLERIAGGWYQARCSCGYDRGPQPDLERDQEQVILVMTALEGSATRILEVARARQDASIREAILAQARRAPDEEHPNRGDVACRFGAIQLLVHGRVVPTQFRGSSCMDPGPY